MNTLLIIVWATIVIVCVIGLFSNKEDRVLWWSFPAGFGVGHALAELALSSGLIK